MSVQPWCLVGDFNEVLCSDEVSSVTFRRQQAIDKFRSVVSQCGLFDIGFRGYKFTYSNKRRGADEVKSRLDRALADRQWINKFRDSSVQHLCSYSSDHDALLVQFEVASYKAKPVFRFERMWLTHDTFKPTVKEEWSKVEGRQLSFASKLQVIQQRLSQWNKDTFGVVKDRSLGLKKLKAHQGAKVSLVAEARGAKKKRAFRSRGALHANKTCK
ncbi:hypothetical protein QQ045_031212 [Rhodiola kirilowii]